LILISRSLPSQWLKNIDFAPLNSSQMIEIVVIVESRADVITATKLAERVIVEKVDWLESEMFQYLVKWRGVDIGTEYSCWKDVDDIINRSKKSGISGHGLGFLGHKNTGILKTDGAPAMKILNLVRYLQKNQAIQGVLLIRDLDNQSERRQGMEQARKVHDNVEPQLAIIIGAADRMREAWVLNGFLPMNAREEKSLADIKTQLTFDPCENAHKLRSNSFEEPDRDRNPKVVLEKLTNEDENRERQCWEETELEILRSRGKNTGLTDYLEEIEKRLLVIFDR
jgi:hypothetical protein